MASYECAVHRGEPSPFNLKFSQLCDGFQDNHPDAENNTDESDCSINEWPCSNRYKKCNGVWNCPDGHDELGCGIGGDSLVHCSLNRSHFCLNITTGHPLCLPQIKAGDGHIDCVGSTDERSFCRMKYPHDIMRRYRCHNSDRCISPFQVCDCHQDCPENDDETIACDWRNNGRESFCHPVNIRCRNGEIIDCTEKLCRCALNTGYCSEDEDKLFCELIDRKGGVVELNWYNKYSNSK